MKTTMIACLCALFMAVAHTTAAAEPRLELGMAVAPVFISDESWEFFDNDFSPLTQFNLDLRVRAFTIANTVSLLPFVSWRIGGSDGRVFIDASRMKTDIQVNDLFGGLRVKGWFKPWIGAFAQVGLGASFIKMSADIPLTENSYGDYRYEDDKAKFFLSGLMGAELRVSPAVLEKHGVKRFNFGGEFAMGLIKRSGTVFKASATGADDQAIVPDNEINFGSINLTGFALQFGLNLYFF
jgi:hypothetical protein